MSPELNVPSAVPPMWQGSNNGLPAFKQILGCLLPPPVAQPSQPTMGCVILATMQTMMAFSC
jgi:hypothetical protein